MSQIDILLYTACTISGILSGIAFKNIWSVIAVALLSATILSFASGILP